MESWRERGGEHIACLYTRGKPAAAERDEVWNIYGHSGQGRQWRLVQLPVRTKGASEKLVSYDGSGMSEPLSRGLLRRAETKHFND